jgi:metal-dependent amidase/aminoacylase/carboxypeptidase family protein
LTGCDTMIMIGNGTAPNGSSRYVHTPHYDFNDEILCIGAAYWASLVKEELGEQSASEACSS